MTEGNIGIQVGASKKAVESARAGIMEILNGGRDDKTTRLALRTLSSITSVNNTTISDSTIMLKGEVEVEEVS